MQPSFEFNENSVFLMIAYRDTNEAHELIQTVKSVLSMYQMRLHLAKDGAFADDLWENASTYMKGCSYGIAIYDASSGSGLNPNVSLELGFMTALQKRCLIMKEQTLPTLPADLSGRLYKIYDKDHIRESVGDLVHRWCTKDLGRRPESLIFSSNRESDWNCHWQTFDRQKRHLGVLTKLRGNADSIDKTNIAQIQTSASHSVGINLPIEALRGRACCRYMAVSSSSRGANISFCVIPMIHGQLIEYGSEGFDDADNAFSPFREKHFVHPRHVSDGQWHHLELKFDFTPFDGVVSSLFAVRINEGCPKKGSGCIQVTDINIYIPAQASDG